MLEHIPAEMRYTAVKTLREAHAEIERLIGSNSSRR